MSTVMAVPDPDMVRRQNQLFDLYSSWPGVGDPDDDPDFVDQARQIMGLPPLKPVGPVTASAARKLEGGALDEFNAKHPRASDGKFGEGVAGHAVGKLLSGVEALDSVPAKLRPGKDAHHGHYEGEHLDAPPSHGAVRALSQYEGTDYQMVNTFLRGRYDGQPGPGQLSEGKDWSFLTEPNHEGEIAIPQIPEEIDKTMAVSRLPHDVVVERTVRHGATVFGRDVWYGDVVDMHTKDFEAQDKQWADWEAGARPDLTGLRWTDHGYSSTTVDPKITAAYADRWVRVNAPTEGEPIVLKITVPAGTGAVALSEQGPRSEAEILLERGLTFEVTADHGIDSSGVRRLDVRVVPAK